MNQYIIERRVENWLEVRKFSTIEDAASFIEAPDVPGVNIDGLRIRKITDQVMHSDSVYLERAADRSKREIAKCS